MDYWLNGTPDLQDAHQYEGLAYGQLANMRIFTIISTM